MRKIGFVQLEMVYLILVVVTVWLQGTHTTIVADTDPFQSSIKILSKLALCLLKMSLSLVRIVTILLFLTSTAAVFTPTRITYDALVEQRDLDSFLSALVTVGMVSITHIPKLDKEALLQSLPECIAKVGVESTFPDGTRRRTLATHTKESHMWEVPTKGELSCESFDSQNGAFRSVVDKVVRHFGSFLETSLPLGTTGSLLEHATNNQVSYSLMDIIREGDHLEHFHAYYTSETEQDSGHLQDITVDWHMDQGFLLAFSPGQSNGQPTDGFYIQLPDGSSEMVKFDERDEIVFFFGDGVNQIINPVLINQGKAPIRALPHALKMPALDQERLWYGLMVLPPSDALHPIHHESFGEIRKKMIQRDERSLYVGCSSSSTTTTSSSRIARLLNEGFNESQCDEDMSYYCWHQCMNYTDYNASPDICESKSLTFGCVDVDGYEWPGGDVHNDSFALRCVEAVLESQYNSTENETHVDGGDHTDEETGDEEGESEEDGDDEGGSGSGGMSLASAFFLSNSVVFVSAFAGMVGLM